MDYIVSFRIKVHNPPWKKVFIDFLRNFIVPLIPLFQIIAKWYGAIRKAVSEAAEFIAGVILSLIAIPVGILVMATMFGIPVVLFCAAMGWIK